MTDSNCIQRDRWCRGESAKGINTERHSWRNSFGRKSMKTIGRPNRHVHLSTAASTDRSKTTIPPASDAQTIVFIRPDHIVRVHLTQLIWADNGPVILTTSERRCSTCVFTCCFSYDNLFGAALLACCVKLAPFLLLLFLWNGSRTQFTNTYARSRMAFPLARLCC